MNEDEDKIPKPAEFQYILHYNCSKKNRSENRNVYEVTRWSEVAQKCIAMRVFFTMLDYVRAGYKLDDLVFCRHVGRGK